MGINMFWALLKLILNESESGPKHIYAREHKLYCYIRLDCLLLADFCQNRRVFSTLQLYSTLDRVAPKIWSILATTPSLVRLPVDVLELFVGGC